jgi:hypothetical protein
MRKVFLVAIVLCTVGMAFGTPINGIYKSQELGGTVIDGHWSEAWFGGQEGAVGSTINAASWDGSTLGTMWEITGPAINATPTLVSSTLEFGMTIEKWYTTYSGGTLKLKNTGPWWNGADSGTEYDLTVNSYSHDTTKYFYGSTFDSATTNVHLNATFNAFPAYTVDFIIAVAVPTGGGVTPPTGYPSFAINAPAGAWGVTQKIRMDITPEPMTLALLGLGALVLRRKA